MYFRVLSAKKGLGLNPNMVILPVYIVEQDALTSYMLLNDLMYERTHFLFL